MTTTPQKITFGEMRASGLHEVLVHCRDHRCSLHVEISADQLPDDVCRPMSGRKKSRRSKLVSDG
jgi:hypothetical protein